MKTLPKQAFRKNAELYRLMANPKRLQILNMLRARKQSFEDLKKALGVPKANLSQHLALLRSARLVGVERVGLSAVYNITDPRIVDPCRILYNLWQTKVI